MNDYGPDPREDLDEQPHDTQTESPLRNTGTVAMSPVEELERLQALRATGAIDEAEFTSLKTRLLGPQR